MTRVVTVHPDQKETRAPRELLEPMATREIRENLERKAIRAATVLLALRVTKALRVPLAPMEIRVIKVS